MSCEQEALTTGMEASPLEHGVCHHVCAACAPSRLVEGPHGRVFLAPERGSHGRTATGRRKILKELLQDSWEETEVAETEAKTTPSTLILIEELGACN